METTFHQLPQDVTELLDQLQKHIELPFYYYGSIQRWDYFPGYSDIDVDIFTNNIGLTLSQFEYFFDIPKRKLKRIHWLYKQKKQIHGYSYRFNQIEFSIYENTYKDIVLQEHRRLMNPLWITSLLLIVLKMFYYLGNMLNIETFAKWKRFLMNDEKDVFWKVKQE
jgi:hypothetical protein